MSVEHADSFEARNTLDVGGTGGFLRYVLRQLRRKS